MPDLKLNWDGEAFAADLAISANDLVAEDGLQTAVELSLFTDRRAEDGDTLPAGETDRRGWWADAAPVVAGDKIGSRLWLLAREKQTATTRQRLEKYAAEALQWLIDDKVAERIEVAASFPSPGIYVLEVEVFRPRADPAKFRFDHAWGDESSLPGAPGDSGPPANPITTTTDAYVVTTSGYLDAL
jgi:phage gp46-like protein